MKSFLLKDKAVAHDLAIQGAKSPRAFMVMTRFWHIQAPTPGAPFTNMDEL